MFAILLAPATLLLIVTSAIAGAAYSAGSDIYLGVKCKIFKKKPAEAKTVQIAPITLPPMPCHDALSEPPKLIPPKLLEEGPLMPEVTPAPAIMSLTTPHGPMESSDTNQLTQSEAEQNLIYRTNIGHDIDPGAELPTFRPLVMEDVPMIQEE